MRNGNKLEGKKVAILATNGFEEVELTSPRNALLEAGADIAIIAPQSGTIISWHEDDWGGQFEVDMAVSEANPSNFDALMLPGGVINPDKLRMDEGAVDFVKAFFEAGKPVAAICHGSQILIDADVVDGRKLTSYPSLQHDLENAGATWVDEEVVVDQGLTTSRSPKDLEAFNKKMIEEIGEGVHHGQHA
ncbi:MAG: type 1 glutamine amidotransferase domain-containing protein [Balneolaceae bacterium]